jgi:benzoate/toluate 1,2-dioxygenase beta subunit
VAKAETETNAVLAGVEKYLYREVRLLDERRFEEWTDLFTEDGYYWVPAYPNQTDPYKAVSIFFDDRQVMRTRLSRLDHPNIHAQKPPSRTVHIVSNIEIDEKHYVEGEILVHSTLQMMEFRLDKQTHYGGRAQHLLLKTDDGFMLKWKRVDLINCDGVFEPLAIPF